MLAWGHALDKCTIALPVEHNRFTYCSNSNKIALKKIKVCLLSSFEAVKLWNFVPKPTIKKTNKENYNYFVFETISFDKTPIHLTKPIFYRTLKKKSTFYSNACHRHQGWWLLSLRDILVYDLHQVISASKWKTSSKYAYWWGDQYER